MALGVPIGQLQRQISSKEFTEYAAFFELEPFGPSVDDVRHGSMMALLASVNRDTKKRKKPYKPQEFMLGEFDKGAEDDKTNVGKIKEKAMRIFGSFARREGE